MFSPEERLTRHGELSIRPKEDVTVHLLFAPTRIACMLAKLEIKQSGVRPSQPGVKFSVRMWLSLSNFFSLPYFLCSARIRRNFALSSKSQMTLNKRIFN